MIEPTSSTRIRDALAAGRAARAHAFGDAISALFGRGGPRGDRH